MKLLNRDGRGRVVGMLAVAVGVLACAGGCASRGSDSASGSATKDTLPRKADGSITAVNAMCPAMPEHPVKKKLDESVVRMYKGKVVGFCCSDCPEQWDAMSEADRDKALAAAMKPAGK